MCLRPLEKTSDSLDMSTECFWSLCQQLLRSHPNFVAFDRPEGNEVGDEMEKFVICACFRDCA